MTLEETLPETQLCMLQFHFFSRNGVSRRHACAVFKSSVQVQVTKYYTSISSYNRAYLAAYMYYGIHKYSNAVPNTQLSCDSQLLFFSALAAGDNASPTPRHQIMQICIRRLACQYYTQKEELPDEQAVAGEEGGRKLGQLGLCSCEGG